MPYEVLASGQLNRFTINNIVLIRLRDVYELPGERLIVYPLAKTTCKLDN